MEKTKEEYSSEKMEIKNLKNESSATPRARLNRPTEMMHLHKADEKIEKYLERVNDDKTKKAKLSDADLSGYDESEKNGGFMPNSLGLLSHKVALFLALR